MASTHDINWGPRPFRFQDCWLTHPGCMKIIKESWNNSRGALPDKLKDLKCNLKSWNSRTFGIIDENIGALEDRILEFDTIANGREFDNDELRSRKEAQLELWQWLRRKEVYWAQNSRARWLKEGDKNTRYFHTIATMRRRRNNIESLSINGSIINNPSEIKQEAVNYFKQIFKEEFE